MLFAAEKIGWGVAARFSGTLHSVFRGAAIIAVGEHSLVTLVPSTAGGLPGAINIDVRPDFDFRAWFAPGAGAALRGDILRLEGSGFSLDLRSAVPWRSRIVELDLDLTQAGPVRAWSSVAASFSKSGRAAAFVGIADRPIRALFNAASAIDAAGTRRAMTRLVGLGAGGTPAGDDFLVGFIAGLSATGLAARPERHAFLVALARHLRSLLDRTNDVSRVYLDAAVEGEVSERLSDLAAAIATGAPSAAVRKIATAAILVGHTSGADGTLGLLLGAAAWGPEAIAQRAAALIEGALVGAGS